MRYLAVACGGEVGCQGAVGSDGETNIRIGGDHGGAFGPVGKLVSGRGIGIQITSLAGCVVSFISRYIAAPCYVGVGGDVKCRFPLVGKRVAADIRRKPPCYF